MKKHLFGFLIIVSLVVGSVLLQVFSFKEGVASNLLSPGQSAVTAAIAQSPFYYDFKAEGFLSETGKMDNSSNPYFWLNSGGQFYSKDGIGKTVQGELSGYSRWRLVYFSSNPIDTDNGYHPQNIFRLVTRSKWQDFQQEVYFKIIKDNLSESEQRDKSNGLLLFNRYQDGDNLYYAGIRVDGAAVIKKKVGGKYFTMAYESLFDGEYNRKSNPNLLTKDTWLGVRSEVETINDGEVLIRLFVDKENNGNWQLVLEAKDDGKSYGGAAILNEGHAGIRTDFMDVEFDNYRIEEAGGR